jgi:hypothetical protein
MTGKGYSVPLCIVVHQNTHIHSDRLAVSLSVALILGIILVIVRWWRNRR